LRLALAPAQERLAVRVLKRRGAELPRPIELDLARAPGAPLYPLLHRPSRTTRSSTPLPAPRHGAWPSHRRAS